MDKYLEIIKKRFKKGKKNENLIVLIILFVILLIAINYIFNNENNEPNITDAISDNISEVNVNTDNLEIKIEKILNSIDGIYDATVAISYVTTEKINPIYDVKEDVETNDGKNKTTIEKKVAYEEISGKKVAIVESKDVAKAEGAIVVFTGSNKQSLILEIKEAVAAITSIPMHKIQVFQN